jgi:hypothetical protein
MEKEPKLTRAEWLDSIPLRGKVFETKSGESITLQTAGALVSVNLKDVRGVRDLSENEKEVLVSSTARITYETIVDPREAQSILSREGVTAAGGLGRFAGGECECSRCSGGECECSRCTSIDLGSRYGRFAGGECECSRCSGGECECSRCASIDLGSRLGRFAGGECECSRCSGGECECSRCIDAGFGSRFGSMGGFRRRIR